MFMKLSASRLRTSVWYIEYEPCDSAELYAPDGWGRWLAGVEERDGKWRLEVRRPQWQKGGVEQRRSYATMGLAIEAANRALMRRGYKAELTAPLYARRLAVGPGAHYSFRWKIPRVCGDAR
mgnify:CR=1 FL=1